MLVRHKISHVLGSTSPLHIYESKNFQVVQLNTCLTISGGAESAFSLAVSAWMNVCDEGIARDGFFMCI